jgi:hypothetical protein
MRRTYQPYLRLFGVCVALALGVLFFALCDRNKVRHLLSAPVYGGRIDVGEFAPGERREVEISLCDNRREYARIDSIRASCGCVRPIVSFILPGPSGDFHARVVVTAPLSSNGSLVARMSYVATPVKGPSHEAHTDLALTVVERFSIVPRRAQPVTVGAQSSATRTLRS